MPPTKENIKKKVLIRFHTPIIVKTCHAMELLRGGIKVFFSQIDGIKIITVSPIFQ